MRFPMSPGRSVIFESLQWWCDDHSCPSIAIEYGASIPIEYHCGTFVGVSPASSCPVLHYRPWTAPDRSLKTIS